MDVREINSLVLAFLGDSVYETYIREYLISQNISNVNDLQKESIKYVSAVNQAKFIKQLLDENFLSEEEIIIVKRGRNCKNSRHPKNCDAITYKYATAFEALIGYLHLNNKEKRIKEIICYILKEI